MTDATALDERSCVHNEQSFEARCETTEMLLITSSLAVPQAQTRIQTRSVQPTCATTVDQANRHVRAELCLHYL